MSRIRECESKAQNRDSEFNATVKSETETGAPLQSPAVTLILGRPTLYSLWSIALSDAL